MSENNNTPEKPPTFNCNFCGKSNEDVVCMIAGPDVFICDECVNMCGEILRIEEAKNMTKAVAKRLGVLYGFVIKAMKDHAIATELGLRLPVVQNIRTKYVWGKYKEHITYYIHYINEGVRLNYDLHQFKEYLNSLMTQEDEEDANED